MDGLTVFQETYNEELYRRFHLGGKNETTAGGSKHRTGEVRPVSDESDWALCWVLGTGAWKAFYMGLHTKYLMRKYWKSQVLHLFSEAAARSGSFSTSASGIGRQFGAIADRLEAIFARHRFHPVHEGACGLSRPPHPLGITSMSAGSKTDPGGYTHPQGNEAEAQFEIADDRDPETVAEVIRQKGYEPVWKDWDEAFLEKLRTDS